MGLDGPILVIFIEFIYIPNKIMGHLMFCSSISHKTISKCFSKYHVLRVTLVIVFVNAVMHIFTKLTCH